MDFNDSVCVLIWRVGGFAWVTQIWRFAKVTQLSAGNPDLSGEARICVCIDSHKTNVVACVPGSYLLLGGFPTMTYRGDSRHWLLVELWYCKVLQWQVSHSKTWKRSSGNDIADSREPKIFVTVASNIDILLQLKPLLQLHVDIMLLLLLLSLVHQILTRVGFTNPLQEGNLSNIDILLPPDATKSLDQALC